MHRSIFAVVLMLCVSGTGVAVAQTVPLGSSAGASEIPQLSLVEEYPKTDILDLSADGRRMLLYARGRVAVFDFEEERKVASWKPGSWATSGWFVDKGNRVFYAGFLGFPRIVTVGRPKVTTFCTARGFFVRLDEHFAMGFLLHEKNTLVRISLEDCSKVEQVTLEIKEGDGVGGPAVSPNGHRFAYLTSRWVNGVTVQLPEETEVWVRDMASFNLVATIDKQQGWPFEGFGFTPDSARLVAGAKEWFSDENVYRFFVFDASSGALIRSFDVPGIVSNWTISPDGTLLAIGVAETEEREGREWSRTGVRLLDFDSGRELAHGSFSWRRVPRRAMRLISWGGRRVASLRFSPDGKKLYASSEDTKVWEIPDFDHTNVGTSTPAQ